MRSFQSTLKSVLVFIFGAAMSALSAPIHFLDTSDARSAVMSDSLYFLSSNVSEMNAKVGRPISGESLRQKQLNCMREYAAGVLSFTEREKSIITEIIARYEPEIESAYPIMKQIPWNFYKLSSPLEGGLPHTDGYNIVLPSGYCDSLTARRQILKEGSFEYLEFFAFGFSVMVHEKIHVAQNARREAFDSLYEQVLDFHRTSVISGMEGLLARRVLNPDARTECWIISATKGDDTVLIHPMLLLASENPETPRMPDDFMEVGVCLNRHGDTCSVILDSGGVPLLLDLQELPSYHLRFRTIGRNPFDAGDDAFAGNYVGLYHPDEIVAEVFGLIVVYDVLNLAKVLPADRSEFFQSHTRDIRRWFSRPI